jgi:positive regulator of sigma E activity
MRQVGYVVAVVGEVADVAVGEHFDCSKCGACLATMGKKRRQIQVTNGIGADVGDKVEVETSPFFAVAAAFLLYIFPIAAGGVGALVGYHLLPAAGLGQTAGAVTAAGAAIVGSALTLRHIEKVYFSRKMPNIVSVLNPGDSNEGRS